MADDKVFKVTVQREVSEKEIAYLLCAAMEGGSNYWYTIAEYIKPAKADLRSILYSGDEAVIYRHVDYPLLPGGALLIQDREDPSSPTWRLDRDSIAKGLQVMADDYPKHFADFLADTGDAITGDVFLQCCLFGKIVYG